MSVFVLVGLELWNALFKFDGIGPARLPIESNFLEQMDAMRCQGSFCPAFNAVKAVRWVEIQRARPWYRCLTFS